jgi:outer membrane protein assembly factor BamB
MKKFFLFASASMLMLSSLVAQRNADWTTVLPDEAKQIFFHTLTGVPIVKGDKYYAGIDMQTKAVKWTVKRSGMQAVGSALGEDDGMDYYDVAETPFAVVNHTLLDTRDGKILLDKEKDGYKKINDYELLNAINAILVRTTGTDGLVKLCLIDKKTGDQKWKISTVKASSGLALTSSGQAPPPVQVAAGTSILFQNNTLMSFQYKKQIIMINLTEGKVLWTNELDPSRTFFSEDEKTIYYVEYDKGGLVAQAMSQGGLKRMGKEITAIDAASGKPTWKNPLEADEVIKSYQIRGNQLLLVHSKGCNFYTLADAKKVWKDDFDAKGITSVDENPEGYLVSYGRYVSKTMQLDKTGKKLWKKPQTPPADPDADEDVMGDDVDYVAYKYSTGTVYLLPLKLNFSPKKKSAVKAFSFDIKPETKLEYDEVRNTVIIFDQEGVTLVNPDKFPKGYVFKRCKTNVSDIQSVEVRKECYYFSGPEDFIIVKPEGEVTEKHYKEPFDGKGFMMGALAATMSVAGAGMQVGGVTKSMKGSGDLIAGELNNNEQMATKGEKNIEKGAKQMNTGNALGEASAFIPPARQSAFSQTRDFAYFFTKDKKADEKVLIKLSKDTGVEVDKLIFNDARPVYKVDEIEDRVLYSNKKQLMVFEPKK